MRTAAVGDGGAQTGQPRVPVKGLVLLASLLRWQAADGTRAGSSWRPMTSETEGLSVEAIRCESFERNTLP